jgi:D-lactate dehydrogenase
MIDRRILDAKPADAYITANRTWEMGFLHATGRPYQSFVFVLEELTRSEQRIEIGPDPTAKA